MPARNAVTFSGNRSRVALNRRSHSSGVNLRVKARGESRAAWRISSEYAFPTPLTMRESVSARFKQRRPPLRPRLSERERARQEIESRQILPAPERGMRGFPMQPPGDRQMQHQPQVAFQPDHDALSHPPQLAHRPSLGVRKRRRRGPKKRRAGQPHAFKRHAITRGSSAAIYAAMSGSSGIPLQLACPRPVRQVPWKTTGVIRRDAASGVWGLFGHVLFASCGNRTIRPLAPRRSCGTLSARTRIDAEERRLRR